MSTTGTNLKQTPFSAIVVDTYAAENEQQISVTAGTEVIVLDNRQSSTMWQVSIGGTGKEIGWIPSSILVFDGMMTPRGNTNGTSSPSNTVAWQMGTKNSQFGDYHLRQTMTIEIPAKAEISTSRSESNNAPSFHPTRGDNPIFYVKAKRTRAAQTVRELYLAKDEIVMVTDCKQSSYWWYGHRQFNPEETGWFPIDFVRKISDEERLRSSGISSSNSPSSSNPNYFRNAPMTSPSKLRERGNGSKYAVNSIATPSNRNKSDASFSFDTQRKKRSADEGRKLMQDSLVDPKRVLRRFVSKGGTEWAEVKSKTKDGVVYVNEASNTWQDERPRSAQPLRRFSSSGGTHWAELVDDQGIHYYHNTETGGRTIVPPTNATNTNKSLKRLTSIDGSTWEEMFDKETGKKYWYNVDKQVSSWEDPTIDAKKAAHETEITPQRRRVPDCIICMDSPACIALIPCWHATYCAGCADKLETCPQCKKKVERRQRFYL